MPEAPRTSLTRTGDARPTAPAMDAVQPEPRVFRPLPEGASIEQLVHAYQEQAAAYATVAFALSHRLPSIETKLDNLGRDLHADRKERKELERDVAEIADELRKLTGRVGSLESAAALARADLPPMRAETKSSHDLAKHVSKDVVAALQAYEQNPSTPPGPPSKDVQEKMIEERVAAALAVRDAARLQKAEDDRLAALRQQAEDARQATLADLAVRRDMRLRTWITILAVIAAIVGTLVARSAK